MIAQSVIDAIESSPAVDPSSPFAAAAYTGFGAADAQPKDLLGQLDHIWLVFGESIAYEYQTFVYYQLTRIEQA